MMSFAARPVLLAVLATALPVLLVSGTTEGGTGESQCDITTRFNDLEEKLAVVDLDSRMAKMEGRMSQMELEGRVASLEQGGCGGCGARQGEPSPGNSSCTMIQELEEVTERLMLVMRVLERLDFSLGADQAEEPYQDEPEPPIVCERGMAATVSEKYVVVDMKSVGNEVVCDAHTEDGGWIVIQRRSGADQDFQQTWERYKSGFGYLAQDFWMGLEAIYTLTNQRSHELRIDMVVSGKEVFARYSTFRIENEADKYRLRLGSYSGSVGQANQRAGLSFSVGAPFSTADEDNDSSSGNCAEVKGPWWHKACYRTNLNGPWDNSKSDRVRWYTGSKWIRPTFVEMKIRPV